MMHIIFCTDAMKVPLKQRGLAHIVVEVLGADDHGNIYNICKNKVSGVKGVFNQHEFNNLLKEALTIL
jgi:hypothetical protein